MLFDMFLGALRRISGFVTPQIVNETEQNKRFLEAEIRAWKYSPERKEQIDGFAYYEGYHDILKKKRTAIGRNGELVEVANLPNRKDIDNQYAIAVDKKANYFLGKPIAFIGENEEYLEHVKLIFDRTMMKRLKNIAKKAMNGGLCWVLPYYVDGVLKFKVFPAYEIKPYWKDSDHDELDFAIRLYNTVRYNGTDRTLVEHVEIYRENGVYRYILDSDGHLVIDPDVEEFVPYVMLDGVGLAWERIPLIAFKYNDAELPLIRRVKGLQDGINELMSMFHNNMLEDNRNTILVIENYDGQDLGEFRQNLSQYGAVKVRSTDGAKGGVSTLSVEVNSANYQAILQTLKDALIENARSFNGKMLNSGTPNQMNILSMYQDIDIDTNDFESEFQSALDQLLYFINAHLSLMGMGDFFDEEIQIVFNRDMLMNESELMTTLIQAGVKISNKTLLAQVPWIDDVDAEMEQIKEENEEAIDSYQGAFAQGGTPPDEDEEDNEE